MTRHNPLSEKIVGDDDFAHVGNVAIRKMSAFKFLLYEALKISCK